MSALVTLVTIFGLLNLAFAGFIYIHSNKSAAITFYILISIFASLWSISTLLTAAGLPLAYIPYALSGHYIFGYLAYLSFFWFALFFPKRLEGALLPALIISAVTIAFIAYIPFSPIIFSSVLPVKELASAIVFNRSGYIAFILMLSLVFFAGLIILLWRLRNVSKDFEYDGIGHEQIYLALLANLIAGTLGISLNLLLPLFGNFSFFYVNPVFVTIALIGIGFYNLLKYHLFNIKTVLTEFFAAGIWIVSFVRLLSSSGTNDAIGNAIILVVSVFFGVMLIQSVIREVKQREHIEQLAKQLEATNERQEGLIHFIGHEVKGFLARDVSAFATLEEGDLGSLPDAQKQFVVNALAQVRGSVASVTDILKAANLKKGTIAYTKEPFDLGEAAREAVEKARPAAEQKGLALSFAAEGDSFTFTGDKGNIADHVLRNLIDNAVAYTPSGSVAVSLKKENGKYLFAVKDSGVGITEEDKARLFTEGGHGKDSQKVNAHSTGYGLYIAKSIAEAHGGTITAYSEGPGHGSTFTLELPAA